MMWRTIDQNAPQDTNESKAFAFNWLMPLATTVKVFAKQWVTAEVTILYIELALLAPRTVKTTVVAIAYTWL